MVNILISNKDVSFANNLENNITSFLKNLPLLDNLCAFIRFS